MEKEFHIVVEYRIQGKVTDYGSDPEHVGTNHEADYDRHSPSKSSAPRETGTET